MDTRIDFLYLSEQDTLRAGAGDLAACVDVSEEVFSLLDLGDYRMSGPFNTSHGAGVYFPKESPFPNMPLDGPDRRFVAMPAYLGGRFEMAGCKWYGSNIENASSGLPRSILMLMLNDKDTGAPVCLLSANILSAARTGANAAVAARHLAKEPTVLTVLGCGQISKICFKSIMTQCPSIRKAYFFDLFQEPAERLAELARTQYGLEAIATTDQQYAMKEADLITSAASRLAPLEIKGDWIKKGALVLLNSPSRGDDAFWLNSRVVLDHPGLHQTYMEEAQAAGSPEEIVKAYFATIGGNLYRLVDEGALPPLDQFATLGQIINGKAPADAEGRTTVFISGGMGIFDVAWGTQIYRNACAAGIGTSLNLWESPAEL